MNLSIVKIRNASVLLLVSQGMFICYMSLHVSLNSLLLLIFKPNCYCFKFKVEAKVMDPTGCTTFVMINRVVSNYIGKPAEDLLESTNPDAPYPDSLCFLIRTFFSKLRFLRGTLLKIGNNLPSNVLPMTHLSLVHTWPNILLR